MKYYILLGVMLVAFARAAVASTNIEIIVTPSSTVSQNNRPAQFKWLLESESGTEAQIGQFACGSYWAAPATGENGVRILSLNGSGKPDQTDLISLDSNPRPHSHGLLGLGTKTYESHNPEENDKPKLPLIYRLSSGSAISLVAAMQRNEAETSSGGTKSIRGGAVDAYCILTLLSEAPANGGKDMIRPNIVGDTKELLTWDDFDLSRLPTHSFIPASTGDSLNTQRMIWNHSTEVFSMRTWDGAAYRSYSEGGRAFRPHILHHNYAAGRAASINNSILSILGGNNTIEEKKPLIASLIAQGLDIWHFKYGREGYPGAWSSGAGQWGGQFMPAVFAAALLKDAAKANELKKTAALNLEDDLNERGPQELRQILRGNTGVLLWGDGHDPRATATKPIPELTRRYWNDLKWGSCYLGAPNDCNQNVGKKTTADPHGYIDGPPAKPGSNYMVIATGNQRSFAAIMVLFPEARSIVNSDDVIEHVDRVHRQGVWAFPDPVASVPETDQSGCNIWSLPGDGVGCSEYRYSWGPDINDARYAIENGVGRFVEYHRSQFKPSYTSPLAESNWDEIMALYDGLRFEDNFVELGVAVAPNIIATPSNNTHLIYMRSGTTDAKIYFTTDGSTPNAQAFLYNGPFETDSPNDIRAISMREDLQPSKIKSLLSTANQKPITPSGLTTSH